MEKKRKEFIGIVVSDKNDKTITIKTETYRKHPLYNKRVKDSSKLTVHDELNKAKVGDKVRVVEAVIMEFRHGGKVVFILLALKKLF